MAKKRDQNQCKDCGYIWYPRGRDLSEECPKCKSPNVAYAGGFGCGVPMLLLLGLGILAAVIGLYEVSKDQAEKGDPVPEHSEAAKNDKAQAEPKGPTDDGEKGNTPPDPEAADSPGTSDTLTDMRTWTAKDGRTLEAKLLRLYLVEGRYVGVFEKPGGETFEYKIGNLSEADVELVKGTVGKN